MRIINTIKNKLKSSKEKIFSLPFSNRDLDKVTEEVVDKKIAFYKRNSFIISSGVEPYLVDSKNFRDFAKIACLIESKIDSKAKFIDREIELMTEGMFNQFLYIKEKVGVDINAYISTIDKNLKKLRTVTTGSAYDTISDNLNMDNTLWSTDKEFYKSFVHELNHCYSYGPIKYGFINIGIGRALGIDIIRRSNLNELETECIQLEMTKMFFPEFVKNERDFEIQFNDGISMQTQVPGNKGCYTELVIMGKMINDCMEDILVKSYLSKDFNDYLDKVVSKEVFKLMEDIRVNYQKINSLKNRGPYNFEDYLQYEDSGAKLIAKLIYDKNIPMIIYEKILNENERFLVKGDEKISLNKRFQEKVVSFINEFQRNNSKDFGTDADEFKLVKSEEKDNKFLTEYKNEIEK